MSAEELVRASNFLNELLRELPFEEVRGRIQSEMEREQALYDALASKALRLGYAATAPLRYGLATAGLLALTLRHQDGVGALERRRRQFIEQIVAQDAALVAYLLDLADEARMVIADL